MVVSEDTTLDVDRDLNQLGPVAVADAGGELSLKPAPDAADADGIVDNVIRSRLANGNRRKTGHDATSTLNDEHGAARTPLSM
jgi:hypothetical protein